MSRLKTLLRVSHLSTCNTQQPLLQVCNAVAQHAHTTQQELLHVSHPSVCNTQQAQTELRRQKAIAMLQQSPTITYAVVTDTESNPHSIIVMLAIRGRVTCELLIPRDRYDGALLLDLIERHCGTMH